jgi:uncharacterized membrane protein
MTIKNPIEWGVDQVRTAATSVGSAGRDVRRTEDDRSAVLDVRKISAADIRGAIAAGIADFGANRTDVIFLVVIYPVLGLILGRIASGAEMLPLLFPLVSGFALVGPIAAVGLYEMSRRREQGHAVNWADAFGVLRSHSLGPIVVLGLVLMGLFVLWLVVAESIYKATLGPEPPASIQSFIQDVFTTGPGWTLIVVGVGAGFVFAVVVLAISVVSFPLLLDRDVGLERAVWTSVRAVATNPGPMAMWGLAVAIGLVLGSIPVFLGLIIVLPVLGHATWHLYRALVPR